jgi:methyl-accepting chemotaxis protein
LNNLLPEISKEMLNQEQQNIKHDIQKEFSDILKSIEQISKGIGSVTGNFENDFLDISGKMQGFVSASKVLSTDSSRFASVFTEKFLKDGIAELNGLLTQFSEYLTKSIEDIKDEIIELNRIHTKLGEIIDNLVNFYKIVKQMRMLCISTKIESARLGNDDRGFNLLADGVEKLANFINDKVKTISGKANELSKKILQSSSKLGQLESEQRLQAKIILSNTNLTLTTFENNYQGTSAKAEEISKSSDDIVTTFNKIVVLIQFHDINRQKLEHISEALNRLIVDVVQEGNSESQINSISDKFGLIHDVCELQTIQLQNARDEFVSAVFDIIGNLENVEKDIDSIAGEINAVLGEEAIFSNNSLNDVKKELTSIQQELSKNGNIGNGIASSIKSVVDIVDDLTKDLIEIEEVGTEIELIALNAIVKAARTGSEGAALGVLAGSIQRLSFDAKSHTSFTFKILENISADSVKLKNNMDSILQDDNNARFLSTNQKISEIIQTIGNLGIEAGSILKRATVNASGLKKEINTTIRGITIHELFQTKVTHLTEQLKTIIDGIKQKNILQSNRKLHTEELLKKYTMHSERTIHHNFTGNDGEGSKSARLKTSSPEGVFHSDNVELF